MQSNCLSVEPVETEFGRKRSINQNSCNKDYSCLKGFCPSFVTVEGGQLRSSKKAGPARPDPFALSALPEPVLPVAEAPWGVVVAGVGGTGVITIGQLLGMAAHLEGKGIVTQDAAGLAQKGGATWSHIQIANRPDAIRTTKVGTAEADLLIACDPIVGANPATLALLREGRSHVALNTHGTPTAVLRPQSRLAVTGRKLRGAAARCRRCSADRPPRCRGTRQSRCSATRCMPIRCCSAMPGSTAGCRSAWLRCKRAIELNGVQVANNKAAFEWGRRAAADLASVQALARRSGGDEKVVQLVRKPSLDQLIATRVEFLVGYQDAAYAAHYRAFVDKVRAAEARVRQRAADRGGRALPVQADGVQG